MLPGTDGGFTWYVPAAIAAMGGLWTLLFLWRLRAADRGTRPESADHGPLPEGARHG